MMMTAREFRTRLARRGRKAGVVVHADLASTLWNYFELLFRWNRKINLTAFDGPDSAIDRLLIEPLLAARFFPPQSTRMLDVGSGGGSPAIPLKLALPGTALVMVEPKARKSAFLREAVRLLDLRDTQVETARFEELLARPDLHEALDIVTVRAVRVERNTLLSLQAFLKSGGRILLFRGGSGLEPTAEAAPPPLTLEGMHPLTPGSRLVILGKRVPRGTMSLDGSP
ncbi:MAG: 16S rRNA (guanine(527)-N(7))-methyltransferase RsmG [Vicinamibacterales bacterium]